MTTEEHAEPKQKSRKQVPVFWLMAAGLWIFYAWWFFAAPSREVVERFFSRGMYRDVVACFTPVTQLFPFSLALVLSVAGLLGFPLLWAGMWVYLRRAKGAPHWRGLLWGPKWLAIGVPFLLAWFVVAWGAGYQRLPAEKRMQFDTSAIAPEEAAHLRGLLLDVIKRDMPPPEQRDVHRAVQAISEAMAEVAAEWDGRAITLPRGVKATPKGLLLFNSTSGVCSPFTLEPHVDGALPDASFVSVAAHELGHIAGCCSEDEATLFGFVSGLRAKDPLARYACALDAYMDLVPGKDRKEALEALPGLAREDLKKAQETYARYRVQWFSKASWKVYNKYLQAQGIKEGVQNYSRGITLFTYAWRKGLTALPK